MKNKLLSKKLLLILVAAAGVLLGWSVKTENAIGTAILNVVDALGL